jgi:hypothetical protein
MGLTNTALPHDIARTFPVLVVAGVVPDRAEARSAQDIEKRVIDLIRHRTSRLPILLAMTREDRSRIPLVYVEN